MDMLGMVKEFHQKNGLPVGATFPETHELSSIATSELIDLVDLLRRYASKCLDYHFKYLTLKDFRLFRMHLMLDELAEFAEGLASLDLVKSADAIADLHYVNTGNAVVLGLPLDKLFAEVHRSNMTKSIVLETETTRRDKGPNYSPPDIQGVLDGRV